jgi:hypothetical protein
LHDGNVFPHVIGRSFYEQVLPPGSVHLAWSSYAAVWLSRIPCLIPGHFFPSCSTGAVRAAFERQAAEDWEAFLSLRSREMRAGARLVVVLPALPDNGVPGFKDLLDHANAVLAEMVDDGEVTSEERKRMVVGSYPRRRDELLAPFAKSGEFQNLVVEDCEISAVPSPAWAEYQAGGDSEALARQQAIFFRAVFMPSLAAALTHGPGGDAAATARFADRLQERMTRRLALSPTPLTSYVQVIVMAKGE